MAFKNKKDKANEFDLNGNETEIFLDETVDSAINSTSNTKKTKKGKFVKGRYNERTSGKLSRSNRHFEKK